ncbi:MAG: cupin domain-containing protein [Thermoguttaceae bacterium]|nr:cupin domain-containing protein [Thermoguttaceae bacterium]MBQ6619875.1 cupin domain-containing protein [Thermoguttaceae bacterium]MBR2585138.1 cupin domain-containing protein [Thermoguttaceae bacterium]
MKEVKKTADIANAAAIDIGPLAEIQDYVLELGPGVKIPGKVFGGAALKAGGADFSFQAFPPGTEGGFYHTHKENEELYFFLSGEGEYQVDGTNIPVKEGTVIRVSPAGKRAVRNTGSVPLTMLCVQYKADVPGSVTPSDGTILEEPVNW